MSDPSQTRRNAPRFGSRTGLVPQARLAGPMPWVIGIMTALTLIAAGAGLALANLAGYARAEIAGGVTVQVIEGAPAERERQTVAALAVLRDRDDLQSVRRVPEDELGKLLQPWLGPQALEGDDAIPIPTLIDVRLRGGAGEARLADLRDALAEPAPSARVDAQADWLAPVFRAISALQWLAVGLVLLLAATSAAAVWLAARSALGSNRDTIEIIHLLGGSDGQIAAIFQRSIGLDAAAGAMAGLVLGLGAIVLLGRQFNDLSAGMVAGAGLHPVDWALLVAVPLLAIVLAIVTARLTVLSSLRRML